MALAHACTYQGNYYLMDETGCTDGPLTMPNEYRRYESKDEREMFVSRFQRFSAKLFYDPWLLQGLPIESVACAAVALRAVMMVALIQTRPPIHILVNVENTGGNNVINVMNLKEAVIQLQVRNMAISCDFEDSKINSSYYPD